MCLAGQLAVHSHLHIVMAVQWCSMFGSKCGLHDIILPFISMVHGLLPRELAR